MRVIGFRAVADELSPSVVWSDQTLWSGMEAVPGNNVANGNRWLRVAGIYPAGSGQLQPQAEIQAAGDWLMLDQISAGGVIVSIRALDCELPDLVLLPGMSIAVPGLRSIRVVAVPEQADFVECRLIVGDGVCPITVGPRMPTGQPQPVTVQRRVSGPGESLASFGGTLAFGIGATPPLAMTLTTWQGARFGGGKIMAALPAYWSLLFVVGPSTLPIVSGGSWNYAAVSGSVNTSALTGYALVGTATNGTATAGFAERVVLDDDPGVYMGYPQTMGLHAIAVSGGAPAATACTIVGACRLRAEAE